MPHITDILVIGGGLAGMQTALHADDHRVTLVDGGVIGDSGASPRAKGGVAVPIDSSDHPSLHARDTVTTGDGLCNHGAVQLATEEGAERLRGLLSLGVPFDRADSGQLALGREAAHSRRRIVRAGGDSTGAAICDTVSRNVRRAAHITLRERCRAVELITETSSDGRSRVVGAWLKHTDGRLEAVLATCTVLATGGIGHLFEFTSNPPEARGSGLGLALRAGASLVDLEFVQFHPTALAVDESPLPLLSEAIRGEGATLVDDRGTRFMLEVHPDAELAPRDVVARAIWARRLAGGGAFLDVSSIDDFATRFPAASADCTRAGFDPVDGLLPVTPAAHYHMGGVAVDLNGRTSVSGLWACGEAAATGLHGANRLASNSLLEALVFGVRVARSTSKVANSTSSRARLVPDLSAMKPPLEESSLDQGDVLAELRRVMWRHVGLVRSARGLQRALAALDRLAARFPRPSPVNDAVTLASLIALAALRRCESRGAHFRSDHSQRSQTWQKRLIFGPDGARSEPVGFKRCFADHDCRMRGLPW